MTGNQECVAPIMRLLTGLETLRLLKRIHAIEESGEDQIQWLVASSPVMLTIYLGLALLSWGSYWLILRGLR